MTTAQLATLAALTEDQRTALGALAQSLFPHAPGANTLPHVKVIPCHDYTIGKCFDTWVVHFADNIRAVYNLDDGDIRINGACIKWLSTKLTPGPTRQVYENLAVDVKADWTRLKAALSQAFTDDKDRLDFLSRLDAHQRTPDMALRTYKDSLLAKMDKYQGALKAVRAEWDRTACQRFREGLKNPLLKAHLMMSCPDDNGIEEAFKIATSWENTLGQLNKDTSQSTGANSLVSALLGIPANDTSTITPKMSALGIAAMDRPIDDRMASLETKVKQNEMHVAEARDGIVNLKTQFAEMKDDIKNGFQNLRKDLGMHGQHGATVARPAVATYHQPAYTPAYQPAQQQGYTGAYQNPQPQQVRYQNPPQQQPRPQNQQNPPQPRANVGTNHGQPVVQGLTPGSQYVNNAPNVMQNPKWQNTGARPQVPNQAAAPTRSTTQQARPVIGAMETTGVAPEVDADGVDWAFSNPMAHGNIGNGWQSFPTENHQSGYVPDPQGLLLFAKQEGFQVPAEAPGGPSPA